jgi:N utilization substance protein B
MRHAGRLAAVQILYQLDTGERWEDARELVPLYFEHLGRELGDEARAFAEELARGVVDEQIARASQHWRLARMSRVDRCILRLAAFELGAAETPPRVVLNEAVELAKELGAEVSAAFVNGILNRVAHDLGLVE